MAEGAILGDVEIGETENAADDVPSCLKRCVQRQNIEPVVMDTRPERR
jgi:hypothetical protein